MGKRSDYQRIGRSPVTRGRARLLFALLCLTMLPTPLLFAAPFDGNWRGPADAFSPENMRGPNPLYRLAPINPNVGSPSGRLESDGGSATGNYHLSIPLVSFPGRGIDLQVTARYNSQIWSKMSEQGSAMFEANADGDWPVPGLNLGFGKLLFPDSPMLINPDGSRQGLTEPNWEFHVNGQHTDRIASKFTDGSGGMVACTASLMRCRDESVVHFASVTQENGRRMEMIAAPGRSTFYPAKIFDANGNFIQIEYRTDSSGNPAPPSIDHISDTAGRWVQFHYDNSGLPIAISAPDQDGGVRVYVRFYYHAFKSVIHVARVGVQQSAVVDLDFPVLDAIYFPGNHTGYVFSDFTEYGIPRTVTVQRNMTASTDALDTQGTFSSGAMTRRSSFNYPDNAQGMWSRKELPAYTKRTDTWANSVNAGGSGEEQQAITTYNKERAGEHRVTGPDGTTTLQGIVTDPTKFDFGLVSWMLTATRDNRWLETRSFIWEPGVANIPRQKEVRIHNHEINAVKRIAFKYGQSNRQITEEIHYDYVAPDKLDQAKILRHRVNRYLDHPVYAARNFTLVSETSLYDGSIANPAFPLWQQQMSQLQGNLDQARANVKPFQDAVDRAQAEVDKHAENEPDPTIERNGHEVRNPAWTTWNNRMKTLRDNLNRAKQDGEAAVQAATYAQGALDSLRQQQPPQTIANEIERTSFSYDPLGLMAIGTNLSNYVPLGDVPRGLTFCVIRLLAADAKSITEASDNRRAISTCFLHDETGNVRAVMNQDDRPDPVNPLSSQVRYTYDASTGFSLPSVIETGAVDPSSSERNRVTMTYNRVGLPTRVTDENGVSSDITYLPGDSEWRKSTVTLSTGAKFISEYNDADLFITQKLVDAEGRQYDQTFRYDGRRLLRTTQATRRTDGGQEVSEFEYDVMGRQTKQSLPRRTSKPTDNPTETLWINYGYDTAGRVTTMTEPTGTVRSWFYNEASVPQGLPGSDLGESVRTVGPWGRESWSRVDALGQLRLVVKPDPVTGRVSDPGRQVAMHSYNARGNLISLSYGEQLRTFTYDSLGRMVGVTVPERAARLDIQGNYVGNGRFSDIYRYDDRNNLVAHIDSRGAKTIYTYANDPLNRLGFISYDISNVGDSTNPVVAAPRTFFEYVQHGDRRRPQTITTEGVMQQSFAYDGRGVLARVTSRFDAAPNSPLEYSTQTDSLGRPTRFLYPARYVNGAIQSGETFLDYEYSNDGELVQLNLNGGVFIENVRYSINGLQHLDIRNQGWRWSEDYDYDLKNGSLSRQTLTRSADSRQNLIDLHYGYSDRHGTGDSGQIRVQEGILGTAIERVHAYDAWGRLLSTKEKTDSFNGNPTQQLYSYDMYGNRLTVQAQLWSQGTGWSDLPASNTDGLNTPSISNNRIQGSDYLYDDAGNLIRGPGPSGIQRYLYDAAGRLVAVQQENGPILEAYQYGADRRRVAVSSDPDRRQWRLSVWSGNSEVARYDVDVSDATRPLNWLDMPLYFGSRLIATMQRDQADGMLKVFHPDHRDIVATTGSGQLGLKPQRVMPFGTENTETTQRDGDIRFTNYRRSEETGLDYAINRYYDPKLGRFIQTDPLSVGAFNVGDPESWNAYTYVLNDPVNRVDPFGLEEKVRPCKDIKIGDKDKKCIGPGGGICRSGACGYL
jgi:RHS repeat-associated protein